MADNANGRPSFANTQTRRTGNRHSLTFPPSHIKVAKRAPPPTMASKSPIHAKAMSGAPARISQDFPKAATVTVIVFGVTERLDLREERNHISMTSTL